MKVGEATIEDYERDGVVCIRDVVDSESCDVLLDASLELMGENVQPYAATLGSKSRMGDNPTVENEPGRNFGGVFLTETIPEFRSFVFESALPEAAAALMRSEVARFFYDQLFIKDPGTVSPTLWHHDMPFWPLTGEHLISCWVALTPVTSESSGLEYIAGSHRWDKFYEPTAPFLRDDTLEPSPDFSDPANRDGLSFLSWDMEPGDVLFHHPLAVHGAGGNKSATQRRVGLSIRYMGSDVQWAPRPKTMQLPLDPDVRVGAYPADDAAFPVAWSRAS
jgi:ectoine hydroxylase-related dioxygenase (phytanoyl-CoA dioxygenase family)